MKLVDDAHGEYRIACIKFFDHRKPYGQLDLGGGRTLKFEDGFECQPKGLREGDLVRYRERDGRAQDILPLRFLTDRDFLLSHFLREEQPMAVRRACYEQAKTLCLGGETLALLHLKAHDYGFLDTLDAVRLVAPLYMKRACGTQQMLVEQHLLQLCSGLNTDVLRTVLPENIWQITVFQGLLPDEERFRYEVDLVDPEEAAQRYLGFGVDVRAKLEAHLPHVLLSHPDIFATLSESRKHRMVKPEPKAPWTPASPTRIVGNWDSGWSLGPYGEDVRAFKYYGRLELLPVWLEQARGAMAGIDDFAAIVPVPPTDPGREHQPVNLFAEELGAKLGRPCWQALRKTRKTQQQKNLRHSTEEQIRNVHGAFEVTHSVAGQSLLLVDDILNSGATLMECAHTLKMAGAKSVRVLVLSHYGTQWSSGEFEELREMVASSEESLLQQLWRRFTERLTRWRA